MMLDDVIRLYLELRCPPFMIAVHGLLSTVQGSPVRIRRTNTQLLYSPMPLLYTLHSRWGIRSGAPLKMFTAACVNIGRSSKRQQKVRYRPRFSSHSLGGKLTQSKHCWLGIQCHWYSDWLYLQANVDLLFFVVFFFLFLSFFSDHINILCTGYLRISMKIS